MSNKKFIILIIRCVNTIEYSNILNNLKKLTLEKSKKQIPSCVIVSLNLKKPSKQNLQSLTIQKEEARKDAVESAQESAKPVWHFPACR